MTIPNLPIGCDEELRWYLRGYERARNELLQEAEARKKTAGTLQQEIEKFQKVLEVAKVALIYYSNEEFNSTCDTDSQLQHVADKALETIKALEKE